MPQIMNEIPFSELRELLASKELSAVEAPIASACHLEIRPCHANLLMSIQGEFRELGLTVPDVLHVLVSDREQLINFGIQVLELEHGHEQQYSPGEEPPEDERDETEPSLATANGFALGLLCWWLFLRNNDKQGLVKFLKFVGILNHKKFADQLFSIYEQIIKT